MPGLAFLGAALGAGAAAGAAAECGHLIGDLRLDSVALGVCVDQVARLESIGSVAPGLRDVGEVRLRGLELGGIHVLGQLLHRAQGIDLGLDLLDHARDGSAQFIPRFRELVLLGGDGGGDVLGLGGDALRDLHRDLVVALVEGVLGRRVRRQDALRQIRCVLRALRLDLVHGSFGGLEGGFCRALLAAGDERHAAQRHGGDPESVLHSRSSLLVVAFGVVRILSANRPKFKWTPCFHGARFWRASCAAPMRWRRRSASFFQSPWITIAGEPPVVSITTSANTTPA